MTLCELHQILHKGKCPICQVTEEKDLQLAILQERVNHLEVSLEICEQTIERLKANGTSRCS